MSKWPEKFVIGLTGNIGTGKSVVRRMLEHLGAYGIDADALSHRAMAKGAPGYDPILSTFGTFILTPDGEIDRARLGRIVFADPQALSRLEAILHPLVDKAVDLIIRRAPQRVIVIEAIKLLESGMGKSCDSIWVSYAPLELQMARLIKNRHMGESEARQRIQSQPPQEDKVAKADITITNVSTFEDTWRQVVKAWQKVVPSAEVAASQTMKPVSLAHGEVTVSRAGPRQVNEIVDLFNNLDNVARKVEPEDVMASLGEKAFLLLQIGRKYAGIIGWQVENLVSRTTDILIDRSLPPAQALPHLIQEMEKASIALQCEASLLFVPDSLARHDALWRSLGYEPRTIASLGVLAWQEAAEESTRPGVTLYFKQLRQDRVLRPI